MVKGRSLLLLTGERRNIEIPESFSLLQKVPHHLGFASGGITRDGTVKKRFQKP